MGQALACGMLAQRFISGKCLLVSDLSKKRLKEARAKLKVNTISCNHELAAQCDVVILAVKPQNVREVLEGMGSSLKGKFLISVCAGISTASLEKVLGKVAVVRAMPNMPAQVSQAVTAISAGKYAKAKHKKQACSILSCIGEVVEVKEKFMDAVTAVSGSGPAYFFYLVENLIDAAKELGIPAHVAQKLAVKTALGSAELMNQSKLSPKALRKQVTSKGGTTEAAFSVFKKAKLNNLLVCGVKAAAKRSKQLSRGV